MAFILAPTATVQCPHGGVAQLATLVGATISTSSGQMLLTMNSIGPVPFTCPSTVPCTSILSWIPAQTKVTIQNQLVVTMDSTPITNGGPGTVIDAGQYKWDV